MSTLLELRQKRGELVTQMREIHSKAAGRELNAEEKSQYDQVFKAQADLGEQIKRSEQLAELERDLAQPSTQVVTPESRAGGKTGEQATAQAQVAAFRSFMQNGVGGMSQTERRDLSAGTNSEGGYTVLPLQLVNDLIKALNSAVFIRPKATIYSVPTATSLGIPTLSADPGDADWTTEVLIGSTDSTMAFGRRDMTPNACAKLVKVTEKLLRVSTLPIEQILMDRLAYKFGVTEEKAFLTGDGSGKPLGLFTASASGVTTARDYATGNSTSAIVADNLIGAHYSVKAQYRAKAEWIMHRDVVKMVAGLKDTTNQYLWRPGLEAGKPDLLLGHPLNESEFAPNTFTTGLYVYIFGDLSNYWIADALDMRVQRLVELYAATNQIGFIGRKETDGAPVLAEAFARGKLG